MGSAREFLILDFWFSIGAVERFARFWRAAPSVMWNVKVKLETGLSVKETGGVGRGAETVSPIYSKDDQVGEKPAWRADFQKKVLGLVGSGRCVSASLYPRTGGIQRYPAVAGERALANGPAVVGDVRIHSTF
jgi:hypothetical protein